MKRFIVVRIGPLSNVLFSTRDLRFNHTFVRADTRRAAEEKGLSKLQGRHPMRPGMGYAYYTVETGE